MSARCRQHEPIGKQRARPPFFPSHGSVNAQLPLDVQPGDGVWLSVPAVALADALCSMNMVVRFDGDGLQLTAFTDSLCLGRVVLGGLPGTVFGGGHGDLFLVPEGEGDLRLYVEATRNVSGRLNSITIGGPVDLPRFHR
ncbi:beta-galactosidase [Bifidobacterium hapali]|uniref:Beta-galactosidase n=2 Tax=Bifidobacterium hapali TaxID=1630172 RepID=A0A261FX85_9BIFI|nr:beta-galactosidase [Bifidobacterium hapali]